MQIRFLVRRILKCGIVFPAVISALVTVGCGRNKQAEQFPVPEVATVTVQFQELELTTELPGRTSAFLVAEIRPQVNGIIQKRLFTEGSDVKTGQVLYQIDPAPFEAALKQAEADIEYWKAAVETARINLGYTRVTAPISGRIGKSNVTDGALVTAYQALPLSTIQQLDPIYVDVPQSTTELLRLKQRLADGRLNQNGSNQSTVKLILEDHSAYPQEGALQFRDVTVDPTTGSVVLRVVFPNPEGILLPGMFVRAVIKEGVNGQAILIPQQAVARDPKGNPIALVADPEGKIQQRKLTLDRAIGDKWLVSSGLATGDRVVVEGLQKVRPGSTVKVNTFDPPRKADADSGNLARPVGKTN